LKKEDSRIRVAFLDHSPEIGGAESSLLTFLRHMDEGRFEATVLLPSEGPFSKKLEEEQIHIKIVDLPFPLIRLKRGNTLTSLLSFIFYLIPFQIFLVQLSTYLKKNRFDLIVTNTIKAHFYGSLAGWLCSIPILWRFHDLLSAPDFSPGVIKAVRFFGKRFPKKILAVSHITKDHLVKHG